VFKCGSSNLPESHQRIRKEMASLIQRRLSQVNDETDANLAKASPSFAQAIEKHLFNTAPSFSAYANPATLNSRLRLVTVALLRRRSRKSQKLHRESILKNKLGEQNHREAVNLIEQIQKYKVRLVAKDCAACNLDGTCSPIDSGIKAQKVAPNAIRRLFFQTRLVTVFDSLPLACLEQQDWPALMEEATSNIRIFQEWENRNKDKASATEQLEDSSEVKEDIVAV